MPGLRWTEKAGNKASVGRFVVRTNLEDQCEIIRYFNSGRRPQPRFDTFMGLIYEIQNESVTIKRLLDLKIP